MQDETIEEVKFKTFEQEVYRVTYIRKNGTTTVSQYKDKDHMNTCMKTIIRSLEYSVKSIQRVTIKMVEVE